MSPAFRSLNLVLMGAPGAGKGTQGHMLAEQFAVPHISTGEMLHDVVAGPSAIGREVDGYMRMGELVPDDLLKGIVLQRLDREDCSRGFILDGYPRSLSQAGLLDGILAELGRSIERVVLLEVADAVAIDRLAARRVHLASGRIYNLRVAPPARDGADDVTGEPLVQPDEDREDVVRERLRAYRAQEANLVRLYEARGLLARVDGARTPAEVAVSVMRAVGSPAVA